MKKNLIFMAIMAVAAISCDKTNSIITNPSEEPYVQALDFSSKIVATKAAIGAYDGEEYPTTWTAGDKVWIWKVGAGGEFYAVESTSTSALRKTQWFSQADYNNFQNFNDGTVGYYGVAPFIEDNYDPKSNPATNNVYAYYYSSQKGFAFMNVPAIQNAVPGGCDPDAMIMSGVARPKFIDGPIPSFVFHNCVSLLEFDLAIPTGYTVTSAVVSVDNFEAQAISQNPTIYETLTETYVPSGNEEKTKGEIAGRRIVFTPNAASWINTVLSVYNETYAVTLKNSDDSPLSSGVNYYIAVWPGQKKNFKITLHGTDDHGNDVSYERSSSQDPTFYKGIVYPLGTIGSKLSKWQ